MKRSHIRNNFLNKKSDVDNKGCNKQCNYIVSLSRKQKNNFYGNLGIAKVTNNRVF